VKQTSKQPPIPIAALFLSSCFLLAWLVVIGDRVFLIDRLPAVIHWTIHVVGLLIGLGWLLWATRSSHQGSVLACAALSMVYIVWWQASIVLTDALVWDTLRVTLARWGTVGLFIIGLGWFVRWVERQTKRASQPTGAPASDPVWNPFNLDAWYYGRQGKKLNQSIGAFAVYSFVFMLVCLMLSQLNGCRETYEMPAGGGVQQQIVQTIKVQKVIRKKFVVNPYSAILFEVPNIDETVKLNLNEVTKHQYEIGYGQGEGAGFSGGTFRGKVRFIRLEYSGSDWDQDFGIGGDLNMLTEYGIRTKHKIAERTESRHVVQLKNFPIGKSPPVVYMTGQKNISFSNNEIKTMREYITDKHGMLFADNGGSRHWENQFFALMNRVLPDVRPVPIPLDDVIHRVPYQIPFLPFVAPHGSRKEAIGWYKDGRWLCYYHPGDIGDAWSDGHAGVKPEIWEACYQLGTNVIFYGHTEYNKWLDAQKKDKT